MRVKSWVRITPTSVELNGEQLKVNASGAALLTELYRTYVNDYPKFFKMDELSKLGFIAAELLLRDEEQSHGEQEDRAVVLFNRSGSICNDRKYQDTIQHDDDFYPSPSIFVYTLPNIVTGEIAIRNHYYGETAFYLLAHRDEQLMRQTAEAAFLDGTTRSVVSGWVDCEQDDRFEAYLELIIKE